MRSDGSNSGEQIEALVRLLDREDESMRRLFAKALNIYVSPGSEARTEKEKVEQLKRAILESVTNGGDSC